MKNLFCVQRCRKAVSLVKSICSIHVLPVGALRLDNVHAIRHNIERFAVTRIFHSLSQEAE